MSIASCLENVRARISKAEKTYGSTSGQVTLLVVSKSQSISAVREAFEAGQGRFGENYVQEALSKMKLLQTQPIEWHFIGAIQSNKIKEIAEHFDWVQSVDRVEIAKHLSACRPYFLPPLQICIEVNLDNQPNKRGVLPEKLLDLAKQVMGLPRLKLRGIMAIPEAVSSFELQRHLFYQLRSLWDSVKPVYPWDVLSVGMSNDFEAAIAEGSTMVRIGTAIFGERIKKNVP